jgi:hypothetical protein
MGMKAKMKAKKTQNSLVLECNSGIVDQSPIMVGGIQVLITPPLDENYWMFRVKLSKSQAILGFPKFGTIGVGFAKERDWNTNLPYTCEAETIFSHIKHNKGRGNIADSDCLKAIRMVQEAAKQTPQHAEYLKRKAANA